MEFGWINGIGAGIVAMLLVPNIVYAVRFPGGGSKCENRWMNLLEQFGRYTSMAFMVFPLGVWKFGFPSVAAMLVYLMGNGGLLAAYWIIWAAYFRKQSRKRAIALAILPTCIFLLSGLTLRHWLLVLAGGSFGVGHIYVTKKSYT